MGDVWTEVPCQFCAGPADVEDSPRCLACDNTGLSLQRDDGIDAQGIHVRQISTDAMRVGAK